MPAPPRAILLCLLLGLRGLEALLAGASAAHGPRLRQAAAIFLSLHQSGQHGRPGDGHEPARPPSLHELVQGADKRLRSGRTQQSPATESIASRRRHEAAAPVSAAPSGTMVAWVIPSKPAVRDQLTLEQAARVHAAVRMLRAGEEVPAVVCFCGGELAGDPNPTPNPDPTPDPDPDPTSDPDPDSDANPGPIRNPDPNPDPGPNPNQAAPREAAPRPSALMVLHTYPYPSPKPQPYPNPSPNPTLSLASPYP
jgi:hypothetical protein